MRGLLISNTKSGFLIMFTQNRRGRLETEEEKKDPKFKIKERGKISDCTKNNAGCINRFHINHELEISMITFNYICLEIFKVVFKEKCVFFLY